MAICETCDYANRPPYKSPCSECDKTMGSPFCCYEHEEKPTNADRIRAMSDEELADWLARTQIDNVAEALEEVGIMIEKTPSLKEESQKEILEWLKQPAEDAGPFHYEKGCQPHGAEQFAKACAVCVNSGSDLCRDCKAEKKSGFEPPF